jgi:MarR family transcriptional regulator, organic hydroperoxide resistance regulator
VLTTNSPAARRDAAQTLSQEIFDLLYDLFGYFKPHLATAAAAVALGPQDAKALRLLDEPMSMRDLAAALTCDASYVTGIVDNLEKDGLVERQVSASDRRVKQIQITDSGRKVCRQLESRLFDDMPGARGMTEEELMALRDGLLRMLQVIRGHQPGDAPS